MLQLTRRAGESITISDAGGTTWMIHVDRVNGRETGAVQLLFEAPPDVKIVRSELGDAEVSGPRRDDAVAAWLKRRRDEWYEPNTGGWHHIDALLDDYRDHADEGTPLAEEVAGPHGDHD
jgi:sRNA-binding carbon storage regulator CsrA